MVTRTLQTVVIDYAAQPRLVLVTVRVEDSVEQTSAERTLVLEDATLNAAATARGADAWDETDLLAALGHAERPVTIPPVETEI